MFMKTLQIILEKDLVHQIIDRPLPIGKNKNVIGLMKVELDGKL